MNESSWSRKEFLRAVLLSQMAVGAGTIAFFDSCDTRSFEAILSARLQKILAAAMDEIIPAEEQMPSASGAGGLNYILNILKEQPTVQTIFRDGLNNLNKRCHEKYKMDFPNASQEIKIEILQEQEKDHSEYFNKLRDYTYESYYLNPRIWKLIGYDPYPTNHSGPSMESFDERLLENVKKKPALYRKI
jgi:Gluconate 2-dehydrogenase subunit 3